MSRLSTLSCALLALITTTVSLAQDRSTQIGFRAGVLEERLQGWFPFLNDGLSSHDDLVAGVFAIQPISGPVSIEGGLQMALRGGRSQAGTVGGNVVRQDLLLRYLEVPLLLRADLPGRIVEPHVAAGLNLAWLLSAQLEQTVSSAPGPHLRTSVTDDMRGFALGAEVGAGLAVRVTKAGTLHLDWRYVYGLTDLLAGSGQFVPTGRMTLQSQGSRLTLGASYRL
jgi:hypothetical protein